MDGVMTKAPLGEKETGPNPTDRSKRGAKRSLLTEGGGVPIGVAIAGANRNDFKLARQTLSSIPVSRPAPTAEEPHGLCLDKGYDYKEVRELAGEFGYTVHVRARRGGTSDQTRGRLQGEAVGGGEDAQLDEPVPADPDPVGDEAGELLFVSIPTLSGRC
jgi:hypothetical protein